MAGGRISLLLCTALALFYRAQCEYEWSGFVNALQQPVNFTCPDNLAISGIASDFRYVRVSNRRGRRLPPRAIQVIESAVSSAARPCLTGGGSSSVHPAEG